MTVKMQSCWKEKNIYNWSLQEKAEHGFEQEDLLREDRKGLESSERRALCHKGNPRLPFQVSVRGEKVRD